VQLIQDQQNEIAQLKGQFEETDVKTEATISAVEHFSARPVASETFTNNNNKYFCLESILYSSQSFCYGIP